jgi:hypothetical protein
MNRSIANPLLKSRAFINKVRRWLTQTRISTTAIPTVVPASYPG